MMHLPSRLIKLLVPLALCSTLQGMDLSKKKTNTPEPAYLNVRYLVAKIAILLLPDEISSEEESSTDSELPQENTLLTKELIRRKIITIFIDALRLNKIQLGINNKLMPLEELCDPALLKKFLYVLHRASYDAHSSSPVPLLAQALKWDHIQNRLYPQIYKRLNTLLTQTDAQDWTADDYRFIFEVFAALLEYPLDKETDGTAVDTLCNNLAQQKTPSCEQLLSCFAKKPQEGRPDNPQYLLIRAAIGLLRCISESKLDTFKELSQLYLSNATF